MTTNVNLDTFNWIKTLTDADPAIRKKRFYITGGLLAAAVQRGAATSDVVNQCLQASRFSERRRANFAKGYLFWKSSEISKEIKFYSAHKEDPSFSIFYRLFYSLNDKNLAFLSRYFDDNYLNQLIDSEHIVFKRFWSVISQENRPLATKIQKMVASKIRPENGWADLQRLFMVSTEEQVEKLLTITLLQETEKPSVRDHQLVKELAIHLLSDELPKIWLSLKKYPPQIGKILAPSFLEGLIARNDKTDTILNLMKQVKLYLLN